ncbi:hypothetical protein T03_14389 [Trichinella britovi]|uniref:Uncharacterized protein n=1 Tax=Trichinella britovi TaxID=45882 RepID=A0A0V1CQA3_TRIBR|nr:hypothetical protein T09_5559 [Trichinella sp. T9]KRY51212.1 hypothetical protein T03_14389 [Trichinella britovi]KRZ89588.1 hypothetical protein T08_11162 [Trichinella sp. T8]
MFVRSAFKQTNKTNVTDFSNTDFGEVDILNTTQPYNATETTAEEKQLKQMNDIHETMDQQQAIKEI